MFVAYRNSSGKVAYDICKERETRNEFRRFMSTYPDKYDYKKANVSTSLVEFNHVVLIYVGYFFSSLCLDTVWFF